MRLAALLVGSVLLMCACDKARPSEPVRQPISGQLCTDLRPANETERKAWELKPEVLAALPRGAHTPVGVVGDQHPDGLRGIGFVVRQSAASFTMHAVRRQLGRQGVTPRPVVAVLPGPPETDQACIVVLTKNANESDVLTLADLGRSGASIESFESLLKRWKEPAGLAIAGVDEGWIRFEIDKLPAEPAPLVADFANFTYAGDAGADKLRSELEQRRSISLAF